MPDLTPAEQRTLTDGERAALLASIGWEWESSEEERIPSPDECASDLYAEVERILAARHAPAADHTATLDRVRALLDEWEADPRGTRALGALGNAPRALRAALDGDTDQCGDPTCDDEHGGGA